jgi:hypothetical protein
MGADPVDYSEPIETTAGTFRVRVDHDAYGVDPRTDGHPVGTMVCQVVRSYPHNTGPREGNLVSAIDDACERGGWRLAVRFLQMARDAVVLPIYGTDRMSTGELGETVDNGSSVSGVIYAPRSRFLPSDGASDTEIAGWLKTEVENYTAWANGETFVYTIERATCCTPCDGECASCWQETDATCGTYYSVDEALQRGRDDIGDGVGPAAPQVKPAAAGDVHCSHDTTAWRPLVNETVPSLCECGSIIYCGREYRPV